MPETVAQKLGLELVENNDIMIRTATNEIQKVKYYTKFNINVTKVIASIKVYVLESEFINKDLDIPQSYSLLLGRRWLYQVRAIGDYATHSYVIYNAVPSSQDRANYLDIHEELPEIELNPEMGPDTQLTDLEQDEIIGTRNGSHLR